MTAGAVIVAAGRSERMGGIDKLFAPLAGLPLLSHTLRAFEGAASVDAVALVMNERNIDAARELVIISRFTKICAVVLGGERRRDSVLAGIEALATTDVIAVHDGARPLVVPALIDRVVSEAVRHGAAICAIPSKDTVKEAEGGQVVRTLDRSRLWLAQTPQAFRRDWLLEAHRVYEGDATDDAMMVEALGCAVRIVEGDPHNLKVTTPEDLHALESLIRLRESV